MLVLSGHDVGVVRMRYQCHWDVMAVLLGCGVGIGIIKMQCWC